MFLHRLSLLSAASVLSLACAQSAHANAPPPLPLPPAPVISLTEDFEGIFPGWENNWFGQHTDVNNYYCAARGCNTRGNNPDGLWIDKPLISFLGGYGNAITSLAVDVAGYVGTNLVAYDKYGTLIYSQAVTLTGGALSDAGVYDHHVISSHNGISRFGFDSLGVPGNTSIDNVTINTPVPEPGTWVLMAAGLLAVGVFVRRRS